MTWSGWNLPPGCFDRHIDEASPGYWDDNRLVRCERCRAEFAREEINMGPWCCAPDCELFDYGHPVTEMDDMEEVP